MYLIHSNGHSATRWISKNLSIDNFLNVTIVQI